MGFVLLSFVWDFLEGLVRGISIEYVVMLTSLFYSNLYAVNQPIYSLFRDSRAPLPPLLLDIFTIIPPPFSHRRALNLSLNRLPSLRLTFLGNYLAYFCNIDQRGVHVFTLYHPPHPILFPKNQLPFHHFFAS